MSCFCINHLVSQIDTRSDSTKGVLDVYTGRGMNDRGASK